MKIRIDKADRVFSQYIRLRDKRCVRCGSRVELNAQGLPISHQASHYFSRGKESTRFEISNVDTLCFFCHMKWGGDEREEYRAFKIKQLGEEGFKKLDILAHTLKKKDRKLAYIVAKQLLKEVMEK